MKDYIQYNSLYTASANSISTNGKIHLNQILEKKRIIVSIVRKYSIQQCREKKVIKGLLCGFDCVWQLNWILNTDIHKQFKIVT